MAILQSGRLFGLACLLVIMAAVAYYIKSAEKGKVPRVRRVAGIDARADVGGLIEAFDADGVRRLGGRLSSG